MIQSRIHNPWFEKQKLYFFMLWLKEKSKLILILRSIAFTFLLIKYSLKIMTNVIMFPLIYHNEKVIVNKHQMYCYNITKDLIYFNMFLWVGKYEIRFVNYFITNFLNVKVMHSFSVYRRITHSVPNIFIFSQMKLWNMTIEIHTPSIVRLVVETPTIVVFLFIFFFNKTMQLDKKLKKKY